MMSRRREDGCRRNTSRYSWSAAVRASMSLAAVVDCTVWWNSVLGNAGRVCHVATAGEVPALRTLSTQPRGPTSLACPATIRRSLPSINQQGECAVEHLETFVLVWVVMGRWRGGFGGVRRLHLVQGSSGLDTCGDDLETHAANVIHRAHERHVRLGLKLERLVLVRHLAHPSVPEPSVSLGPRLGWPVRPRRW